MPNGVSPRATSISAARTLSDSASRALTPFHNDSDSSEALAYLPAGTVCVWPTAATVAERGEDGGGPLQVDARLACFRCDQHQLVTQQIASRGRFELVALLQVVHPFQVGGEEGIGGRALFDLARER